MSSHARRLGAAIVTIGVFGGAGACSDDPAAPQPVGDQLILPVRIHILHSETVTSLNAGIDEAQLDELMNNVNRVWQDAGVRWDVVAVFDEPTTSTQAFLRVRDGLLPLDANVLLGVLSPANRVSGAWDIYLFHDMGAASAAGLYLRGGLTLSNLATGDGPVDLEDFAARVLAHELGHSLALPHVQCVPEGNLMAPGCPAADRTRLEPLQIDLARSQARLGRPF